MRDEEADRALKRKTEGYRHPPRTDGGSSGSFDCEWPQVMGAGGGVHSQRSRREVAGAPEDLAL